MLRKVLAHRVPVVKCLRLFEAVKCQAFIQVVTTVGLHRTAFC